MKILYLAPDINLTLDQSGGAGTHMRATLESLSRSHEVMVAIGGDMIKPAAPTPSQAADSNSSPGLAQQLKRAISPFVPDFLRRFVRDYRKQGADEKVFHLVKAMIEKEGKPDIIYERSGYGYGCGIRIAELFDIPRCIESDVILLDLVRPDTSWIFNRHIYRRLEEKKIHQAESVAVPSPYAVKVAKEYWNLPHDRIYNKDLGITLKHLQPNPAVDVPEKYGLKDRFTIGYLGIIQAYHNIPILLKAAQSLKGTDTSFLIVGNGKNMNKYQSFVEKHALKDVIFTGLVDKSVVGSYIDAMDMALIPGCAFHMYPVKFLEFGGQRITTLVPRYEVFRPFYSSEEMYLAHTFEPTSPESLVRQITQLREMYPDLDAEREHIRSFILENNTWDRCGELVEHALEETLQYYRSLSGQVADLQPQ